MADSAPKTVRSRGAYAKGVARRQEILDVAIGVFAQRGADRTSLRAIAQEVGVTHAALIHHFGSLEQLLVDVYRESARRLEREARGADDVSPVETMRLSAERNREVPGMVQLYTTLVAAALEEGHPAATTFATERFARRPGDAGRPRQTTARRRPHPLGCRRGPGSRPRHRRV